MFFLRILLVSAAAMACFSGVVQSQPYPAKQLRLVVPFPPGGGTDILARLFAQKLSDSWGRPVVVDNRPGADTLIGSELVANANPDGYTLLVIVPSHVINPSVRVKMPFDTLRAFAPVTLIATSPFVLVVNNRVSARDARELIALAKAKPGALAFGSGEWSTRLAGELFRHMAGVDMFNVSYKGSAPVVTDILGGHIPVAWSSLVTTLPFHEQGSLRILGVSTATRSPLLPDVPTIGESGLTGYDTSVWYGLCAPAGTPSEIVGKVQRDIARVSGQSDVKDGLLKLGATPSAMAPDLFAAFLESELRRAATTLKAAGIKPQ